MDKTSGFTCAFLFVFAATASARNGAPSTTAASRCVAAAMPRNSESR